MKIKVLLIVLMLFLPVSVFAKDYVIGEGDGLEISVWGVKDLNVSVRVRPDGKITIPGIGDVAVSGTTPMELQGQLALKMKDLVKNPIVTVSVRDITNSKVYIFGGGVNSFVFELNRRTTLLQLLCQIGNSSGKGVVGTAPAGSDNFPDYKNAYVLRSGKKIKENFYTLFVEGNMNEDIVIEPNDAIFIPKLLDRNIYVLGAVNTPRSIEYRESMTVMQAILEAGGFTKFANQNSTIILRKNGTKEQSIEVRAKDLVKDGDLKQNVKLNPGDYVIISESIF